MIFLFLTVVLWGTTAIFDKLALGKVAPFTGIMVRQFIIAGMLLLAGLGSNRLVQLGALEGRSILLFGLSGICGGLIALWTYYHALRLGGASLVVPIAATYPLVTAFLSWAVLGESLTWPRIIGTGFIVLGIWMVK